MKILVQKNNLSKEINNIFNIAQRTHNYDDLQLITFKEKQKSMYKLDFPIYLKGIPKNFQYWGINVSSDSFYSYHEFNTKTLKIEIRNEKVELRFPKSLTDKIIYLRVILNLSNNRSTDEIITKKVHARFMENDNKSQFSSIFFYSGKGHNLILTLLEGWYTIKSSIYNNDSEQAAPHLIKM
nr:hypothetical protein LKV13_05045 [Borrelia sp. BU AG58]